MNFDVVRADNDLRLDQRESHPSDELVAFDGLADTYIAIGYHELRRARAVLPCR